MAENTLIELVVAMLQTAYDPEAPIAFGQRLSLASRDRTITEGKRSWPSRRSTPTT
jgi:hypothetical protein